jgi:hypothetical protein
MEKRWMQEEDRVAIYNLSGEELVKLWWDTRDDALAVKNKVNADYLFFITHEGNRRATAAKLRFADGHEKGSHRNRLYESVVQLKHFVRAVKERAELLSALDEAYGWLMDRRIRGETLKIRKLIDVVLTRTK